MFVERPNPTLVNRNVNSDAQSAVELGRTKTMMGDFDQRDDLEQFLQSDLPSGWADAARAADETTLTRLSASLNKGESCVGCGATGWMAPHWASAYGGRGLSLGDASMAIAMRRPRR
ncbi:MAG: hypothetical protein WCK21_09180 [Actinomycetota bacterium]